MRHFSFISITILLFGIGLSVDVYAVQACSNDGTVLLDSLIAASDTIVQGRFVELDPMGMNGIFKVDQYLYGGSGPEYLLLEMNDALSIGQATAGRITSGNCSQLYSDFALDETAVIHLKRQATGSYRPAIQGVSYYTFPNSGTHTAVRITNIASDDNSPLDFSLGQLISYITTRLNSQASPPQPDMPYPLKAPIYLETSTGQRYLLPVDRSQPQPITSEQAFHLQHDQAGCIPAPCLAYSPDGLNLIHLVTAENSSPTPPSDPATLVYRIPGDRVQIAPSNEWFALWRFNRIEIYTFYYGRLGIHNDDLTPKLIQSTEVDPSSLALPAAWSADGRYLAFSDAMGLWLWDVTLRSSTPKLAIPTMTEIPQARYFSPGGHFLAVNIGSSRFTLNVTNGDRLPDGLVSPDDRLLLAFDTTSEEIDRFVVQMLVPMWMQRESNPFIVSQQVEWFDEDEFIHSGCGRGYYRNEITYVDEPFCTTYQIYVGNSTIGIVRSWGTAGTDHGGPFDYDHQNESILRVIGSQRLAIDHDELDLSGQIQGEITKASWLASLFYYGGAS